MGSITVGPLPAVQRAHYNHAVGPLPGPGPGSRDGPDRSLLQKLTLLVVAAARSLSNWPFLNTRPSPVCLHAHPAAAAQRGRLVHAHRVRPGSGPRRQGLTHMRREQGPGQPQAPRRSVIYPEFPLDLTGFFSGKHLIHFLVNKMQDFQNFVLHHELHSHFRR